MPWLAIAYGLGIVFYFTADREPAWWAATGLALAGGAMAILARRHPVGFPLALGFAAIAAGFATATLRTEIVAHPVLRFSASSMTLSGFVEIREERERSDRITIRINRIDSGRRLTDMPKRVRLAVRKNTAPAVGSFIELKAHLSPPLAPLRPGGYDFARDMYFQSIGASGYAHRQRCEPARRRAVRRRRLHRAFSRRPAGVVCPIGRSLRRGLRARRRGGQRARGAGRMRRHLDRPQCLARQWRHRAALDRRPFRAQRGASARLRAPVGEGITERERDRLGNASSGCA